MKENIKKLWENYLISIGEKPNNTNLECKMIDYFGNEEIADELFSLVYEGKKNSNLWQSLELRIRKS